MLETLIWIMVVVGPNGRPAQNSDHFPPAVIAQYHEYKQCEDNANRLRKYSKSKFVCIQGLRHD